MKLRNKVAVITGSSRGIGAATARLFSQEGASDDSSYITGHVLVVDGGYSLK